MPRWILLFCCLIAPLQGVGLRVASFNIGAHFGENGYFDYSLGGPETLDHSSVAAVLSRIDADVVALQEVHAVDVAGDPDDLDALAESLGYPHIHVASSSGAFDFSLKVVILSRFPFVWKELVGSPIGAKEMTRNFAAVKVDVPGIENDPVILTGHLKSGGGLDDRFRRAIEMRRLADFLETRRIGDEGENFIVLGDFNPSGIDREFAAIPDGVPASFVLGEDVVFPVSYSTDMRRYLSASSPKLLDARQLDGSDGTYESGQKLDLLMVSPGIAGRAYGTEIYNSMLDVVNGQGLPKSGSPLSVTTSMLASDHYALFADLDLGVDGDSGPYEFHQAGERVVEGFDGFLGRVDPGHWTSDVNLWLGLDDGGSALGGARSYGRGEDQSLGLLPVGQGMVAEAKFVNESPLPLTVLEIDYLAEQWRSSLGGSADEIQFDLVVGGDARRLEDLSFVARTDLPDGRLESEHTEQKSTLVSGILIPPGESFLLRASFVPGAGWGAPSSEIFINEIHYDNDGSDTGEFVEVVVGPGFQDELSSVEVVLYNGSGGKVYGSTHGLESFTEGEVTDGGFRFFSKQISGLQNGASDGLAVVVNGQLSSFVSYEGVLVANEGPASGLTSVDVGVSQTANEAIGTASIGLTGSAGTLSELDWTKFDGQPHSPGRLNPGQQLSLPGLPPQGLAIDDLVVRFVPDNDLDGLGDDDDPDDDGDGMDDAQELAFGSDPFDSASKFEVLFGSSGNGLEMSFPSTAGIDYLIEGGNDLIRWEELSSHAGTGAVLRVELPDLGRRGYYRVRVVE